MHERMNKYE